METINQFFLTTTALNVIRYFVLAGIPFLIFYRLLTKRFSSSKIQQRFAKSKTFRREILHSMQTSMIIGITIAIMLGTPLRAYVNVYTDINAYPLWWLPVSFIIAIIVHDTYFYWTHRAIHHPKLFKHIHLEHHKSTNPSPWTSYSLHFLEGALEAMVGPILLLIIPFHPIVLYLFVTMAFVMNVYGHLGFEVVPKWFRQSFLFEIMNTSVHHNLHHEKSKGNYGYYFRIWDRLMGTEHPDYVKVFDQLQKKRFGK